jgi:CheY-like chemotaxis protein
MPEKNGYEVCEAVKSDPDTAAIPVLLLSGTFEPFDRDRADRARADRVVSKPFDAPHLLDQIDSLLSRDAGAASTDSSASREGRFETAFLDDTIPMARSARESGSAERAIPAETSPSRAEEGQGLAAGAPARAGDGPPVAGNEPAGAEDFSGGPVFLPIREPRGATEEARALHPVEGAGAAERSPAGSHEGEVEIEISAEEAKAFFDVPAGPAPTAPSPTPAGSDLTEEQIERIAALVVAKLSDRVLREIVWEVVPDVAETVVKRRIEELESGAE